VLAETGWLLDRQLGPAAEAALYRSVADGEIVVEPLARADWTRIAELTERYSDQHLGGVDASLMPPPSASASPRSQPSTGATSASCDPATPRFSL
jgi:hypothetical protein